MCAQSMPIYSQIRFVANLSNDYFSHSRGTLSILTIQRLFLSFQQFCVMPSYIHTFELCGYGYNILFSRLGGVVAVVVFVAAVGDAIVWQPAFTWRNFDFLHTHKKTYCAESMVAVRMRCKALLLYLSCSCPFFFIFLCTADDIGQIPSLCLCIPHVYAPQRNVHRYALRANTFRVGEIPKRINTVKWTIY